MTGCTSSDDGDGRVAPAFDLESLSDEGDRVTLAEYAGAPVVLNFWASWCAPCVKEMPLLERAHQRYGDEVRFVGIDGNDSRRLARRLMAETGVNEASSTAIVVSRMVQSSCPRVRNPARRATSLRSSWAPSP